MFHSHTEIPWLEISDISSSIKVPEVQIWDGFLPIGGAILDIVTKLSTQGNDRTLTPYTDKFSLEVEHIVSFDGLSLRKMDLWTLRNAFTLKSAGKLSVKNKQTDMPDLAKDFSEVGLEVLGLPIVQPLYKIWKRLLGKTNLLWNMSYTSPFGANLQIGDNPIWELSTITHKWNKYILQGDEEKFDTDIHRLDGKPVLRNTSHLQIGDTQWKQLAARINIPIFGLSRDHARDVIISIESVIKEASNTHKKILVGTGISSINLWPVKYRTVLQWQ